MSEEKIKCEVCGKDEDVLKISAIYTNPSTGERKKDNFNICKTCFYVSGITMATAKRLMEQIKDPKEKEKALEGIKKVIEVSIMAPKYEFLILSD